MFRPAPRGSTKQRAQQTFDNAGSLRPQNAGQSSDSQARNVGLRVAEETRRARTETVAVIVVRPDGRLLGKSAIQVIAAPEKPTFGQTHSSLPPRSFPN